MKLCSIKSIENAGIEEVWDVSMTGDEDFFESEPNFIAQDILVHNCHAAGILISPVPLSRIAPLHNTTGRGDEGPKKVLATQFPMSDVENLGLIKFDVLGLSTLTAIDWACKSIEEGHDVKIDWNRVPMDDESTFDLLKSGKTDGCFQLECVSGKTFVSAHYNIEELYNSWSNGDISKIKPKSVDLANGCYKMSHISKVVKSEVKLPLFKIETECNKEIRCTLKHNFLTPNGWKMLKELKIGDSVLVDLKSVCSKSCINCGIEVKSRNKGLSKTKFCKICSAKFTKNSSRKETRKKISTATKNRVPWNKGMKYKSEYPSLLLKLQKYYSSRKGKSLEEQHGCKRALEIKKNMSLRMKGQKNHMFGRSPAHRKGGFRKDLGHYVRSRWEADVARIYVYLNKKYLYEPKTFPVTIEGEVYSYTPDFYLVDEDRYVEVKGYMRELDQKKIDAFLEQYNENFSLIRKHEIAELEFEFRDLVEWECGSLPKSCGWEQITNIAYERDDFVFDISMADEFKNYRANGFIVHNSPGMKECLRQINIDSFEDLAVAVAMYRPGPKDYIPDFAARKHGNVRVNYSHPLLEKITKPTWGILVFQEQMMQAFMSLANLTATDGYSFMKGCAKKKTDVIASYKSKFVNGCIDNGVEKRIAITIFKDMEKFGGYAFNRSHAVSYALISYQTAYLKAHYPTEFITARLSVESIRRNFDDIEKYEKDAIKNFGFTILKPDINLSKSQWSIVDEKKLRKPLLQKGVGIKAADDIVANQPYRGKDLLYSFAIQVGSSVSSKIVEAMKDNGMWKGIDKETLKKNFVQIRKDKKRLKGRPTKDIFA